MIEIGLGHYLSLGAIIFFLGVIGIFLNRKNVIVILMSIELILLSVNINLISFSIFSGDIVGQIFTMLILTVAAAEAAIGLIVSVLILLELLVVVGGWKYKDDLMSSSTLNLSDISNTHQLGLVMYTDYILYFQLAGIILLLSMIGAILLTFRQRKGVKKQSYFNQISRNPSSSVELRDVESNKGVKIDD